MSAVHRLSRTEAFSYPVLPFDLMRQTYVVASWCPQCATSGYSLSELTFDHIPLKGGSGSTSRHVWPHFLHLNQASMRPPTPPRVFTTGTSRNKSLLLISTLNWSNSEKASKPPGTRY